MASTLVHITLDNLAEAATQLISLAGDKRLWTFEGEMGTGKTTLVKALCAQLGVTDEISSPTFSLVNEYKTQTGGKIFHFDFYRIKNLEEVYDIGYEDYFYSGSICLIEWPDKIEELLEGENILRIELQKEEDNSRTISVA
jgi:tRNA threonylcarbamoyladenosine biosynthesis protein TsaE